MFILVLPISTLLFFFPKLIGRRAAYYIKKESPDRKNTVLCTSRNKGQSGWAKKYQKKKKITPLFCIFPI